MKVLFFLNDFLPYPSGAGGFVMTWALLGELTARGHAVSVVRYGMADANKLPWLLKAESLMEDRGITIHKLASSSPSQRDKRVALIRKAIAPKLTDFYPRMIDPERLNNLLRETNPDLLYLFMPKSVVQVSDCVHSSIKAASFVDLDSDQLRQRRRELSSQSRLEFLYKILGMLSARRVDEYFRSLGARCDHLTVHAANTANWMRKHGVKCVYRPNPVEDPIQQGHELRGLRGCAQGRIRMSLVGSISGVSTVAGLRYLAEELLPVVQPEDLQRYEFHIIGHGRPPEAIRRKLARFAKVKFRGFVDNISAEFHAADILLVPTPIELGFRTRIAQAFAYRSVVLAHRANFAGMPELDHGTNCVLFKNPQEFVSLLRQLKSDPLFCAKLADGARKTFETHYDARVVCGRMVDDFERIVESRTLQEKGVALTVSGKQPV